MAATLDEHAASEDAEAGRRNVEAAVSSKRPVPGFRQQGNRATLTLDLDQKLTDIPTLLRHFDIDPDAWHVERVVPKVWESFSKLPNGDQQRISLRYLSVSLVPKTLVWPVVSSVCSGKHTKLKTTRPIAAGTTRLVAILSDQQAPFIDEAVHELVLRWLDHNTPDELVINGDAIDLPSLSRHRRNPAMTLGDGALELQRGLDATHAMLGEYVQASGARRTRYSPGNHEQRLQNWLMDHAAAIWGVARANEHAAVFTIPYLLKLDDLGIEWVTDPTAGSYEHAKVEIAPKLAAMHGWIARNKSGMSALATLEHLGHSVVIGHTHRQALVMRTQWELTDEPRVLVAAEGGALCVARGGLGYAPSPNWQQGFVTVRVYADETFKLDLVQVVKGALFWGPQQVRRTARGIRVVE